MGVIPTVVSTLEEQVLSGIEFASVKAGLTYVRKLMRVCFKFQVPVIWLTAQSWQMNLGKKTGDGAMFWCLIRAARRRQMWTLGDMEYDVACYPELQGDLAVAGSWTDMSRRM